MKWIQRIVAGLCTLTLLPQVATSASALQGAPAVEKVVITLPEDLRPGETVSGTILASDGTSVSAFGVDGQWSRGRFRLKVPTWAGLTGLSFQIVSGNERRSHWVAVRGDSIATIERSFTDFFAPPAVVMGTPIRINGPFDGDSSNTKVTSMRQPVEVLAESPRAAWFQMPGNASGNTEFTVNEGSTQGVVSTNAVRVQVQISQPSILTGQTAIARLMVTGLKGLTKPLTVHATTTHPEVVRTEGGRFQAITIKPSEVASDGGWSHDLKLVGVSPGQYAVQLRVPFQEEPRSTESERGFAIQWESRPEKLNSTMPLRLGVQCTAKSEPALAVRFQVSRLDGGSPRVVDATSTGRQSWRATLPPRSLDTGYYIVTAFAAGGNGQTATATATMQVNDPTAAPVFPGLSGNGLVAQLSQIKGKWGDPIAASFGSIEDLWRESSEHRKKAAHARSEAEDLRGEADELRRQARALEAIDKRLADELADELGKMRALAKEIASLAGTTGNATIDELKKQVDAMKDELKSCDEDCRKKKKSVSDLEAEISGLERDLEGIASQVQDLFRSDGWTGSARFDKAAGIIRWGFTGKTDGSCEINRYGSEANRKLNELDRLRAAKQKRLKQAKEDLAKAKEAQKECEEQCRVKAAAVKAAEEAAAKGEEKRVKEAALDAKCYELEEIVARLKRYLASHPELAKALERAIDDLAYKCPRTPDEVEEWANKLSDLMDAKAKLEEDLTSDAKNKEAEAAQKEDEAKDADSEAAAAEDAARSEQQRIAQEERNRRAAEARAVEEAAKAKVAANKREAELRKQAEDAFRKWLEDGVKKGYLDDSDLEKLLKDLLSKGVDVGGAVGSAAGEALKAAAKGSSGGVIGRAALFEGIFQFYATIFYWVMDGELRGAIDRLRPGFNQKEFQEVIAEIELERKKERYGVIEGRGKSYFWMRQGNRIIVFRLTRDGGVEVIGAT